MAGNYVAKLVKLIQEGKISAGDAQHVQVLHDSRCAINRGRDCNCDPDLEVGTADEMRDTVIPGWGRIQ